MFIYKYSQPIKILCHFTIYVLIIDIYMQKGETDTRDQSLKCK